MGDDDEWTDVVGDGVVGFLKMHSPKHFQGGEDVEVTSFFSPVNSPRSYCDYELVLWRGPAVSPPPRVCSPPGWPILV